MHQTVGRKCISHAFGDKQELRSTEITRNSGVSSITLTSELFPHKNDASFEDGG